MPTLWIINDDDVSVDRTILFLPVLFIVPLGPLLEKSLVFIRQNGTFGIYSLQDVLNVRTKNPFRLELK